MTVPIVLFNYRCRNARCGTEFQSGAAAPQCPACGGIDLARIGTAAELAVPPPVPAGVVPDSDQIAAQVQAQIGSVQTLRYRCRVCPWTKDYPANAEPPAAITEHERSHATEFLR
jgi:rubredoxin